MTNDILQNIDFTSRHLHVDVDELTIRVIQPNQDTIGEHPDHWNEIAERTFCNHC